MIYNIKEYVQPINELKDYVRWQYGVDNDIWIDGMAHVIQREQIEEFEHLERKIGEICNGNKR